jgi:hypothetical protein
MAKAEDILAENLKEAIKRTQRHITFATSAALFLLLLVVHDWTKVAKKTIHVPIVGVETDRFMAEVIAALAYFISGLLAYLAISRARIIMGRLKSSPEIREAVLMYPSVPTIVRTDMRMAALLIPVLLFLASTVPFLFLTKDDKWWGLLLIIVMFSSPYIFLMRQLRYPLGVTKYRLTAQAINDLRASPLSRDLVTKLHTLQDKEYSNRDLFIEALQKEVGRIEPLSHRRFILLCACEEEAIES